ncbi:MAG: cysteine desulfurase [Bacteroidales bacterium]|jgi:cysteine desulfurase/selenocysteine lyase|nr:cysteine desulfurase [Bacteroidales bacterium]
MNIDKIRADFPVLSLKPRGRQLIYLDNAATTQKPQAVIDTLATYYQTENANVHRGVHFLSNEATEHFEAARDSVKEFINAADRCEVIFTRGTTESINLVASSFCKTLRRGDEIIVSEMEHHSNIVPWQLAALEHGLEIRVLPFDDSGELMQNELKHLINKRTRLVAITQVSNALGTVNDVKNVIETAHKFSIPVLIDGAQAIAHTKVDVRALDCDFYCFSGHKLYAPMGIGILYGKKEILQQLPPYQGGGEMIKEVSFSGTSFNDLPYRFEAGTPDVANALGLKTALEYVNTVGIEQISAYESSLLEYATTKLQSIEGLRLIGTAERKAAVISFLIGEAHPFDVGTLLDQMGIAVRSGHHCAQPVMNHYDIVGTVRASFAFYNTFNEVDALTDALKQISQMLL